LNDLETTVLQVLSADKVDKAKAILRAKNFDRRSEAERSGPTSKLRQITQAG
jgi:hypothetical protein